MEQQSNEPAAVASPWTLPETSTRHDGWTGERMATFCETLAETGLVVDACLAAGKSTVGAYAVRRRNPLFAAAWEAALTIARERLADTLLARSIEGTVEQYYKDGELVGERKVIDNRLGLAILKRLDKMAEEQFPGAGRGPGAAKQRSHAALDSGLRRKTVDWDLALSALRSGEEDAVAEALAMLQGDELNELNDPRIHTPDEPEGLDLSDRCWRDGIEGMWMTDFPPPEGFTGYEQGDYGEGDYERECTAEEVAILEADAAAVTAAGRAEDEALRDAWFEMLRDPAPRGPELGRRDSRVVEVKICTDQ